MLVFFILLTLKYQRLCEKKSNRSLSSENQSLIKDCIKAIQALAAFSGTINLNISVYPSSSPAPDNRPPKDARTKRLFLTPDGDEDYSRTTEERNRFLNYLSDHHLSQRQLDCSRDNPVIKAIICFSHKWKRLRYLTKPAPAALLRFLTDTCRLSLAADSEAIAALLGRMLKTDYDKEVYYDVDTYFN